MSLRARRKERAEGVVVAWFALVLIAAVACFERREL
jgi:hypothetical protein